MENCPSTSCLHATAISYQSATNHTEGVLVAHADRRIHRNSRDSLQAASASSNGGEGLGSIPLGGGDGVGAGDGIEVLEDAGVEPHGARACPPGSGGRAPPSSADPPGEPPPPPPDAAAAGALPPRPPVPLPRRRVHRRSWVVAVMQTRGRPSGQRAVAWRVELVREIERGARRRACRRHRDLTGGGHAPENGPMGEGES
jgi:hypothetical protein